MPAWSSEQLDQIGRTNDLEIAPRSEDGSLRTFTTIWVVRVDDDVYVRSWNGPYGYWYRAATASGTGRIRSSGREFDVSFAPAAAERTAIDQAYHNKYGRSRYVDAMTEDGPGATTLRLIPT